MESKEIKTQDNNGDSLTAMAATYCLGVFNDNYFKQAAMLLAVTAGVNQLQGWAAILFALPFILFSAQGGWCADRFAKKRVVIYSKMLELGAMLVGGFGLFIGSWPCILAMIFLMGLQSTFFSPSLNGSIPELYPAEVVPRVNALLKLTTTLAILLGVAVAGISLDQRWFEMGEISFGVVLVAAVVVVVALGGLLTSLGIKNQPAVDRKYSTPCPWFGPLQSIRDLREICVDKELLLAIVADTYFYFIASITVLVVNAIGLQQYGFSQTMTSLLSVSLMLGVCFGSLVAAHLGKNVSWSSLIAPSAFGLAFGLLLSGMSGVLSDNFKFWWLMVALGISGIAGGLFLIPVTSFLQVRPEATSKGRVLAAAGFSSFSAILLSGVFYNFFEPLLTPTTFITALGGLTVMAGIFFHGFSHSTSPSPKTFMGRIMRLFLSFRYRVEVTGLEEIETTGKTGILFMPNHPALIDPVIVMSALHDRFAPRPLSAVEQIDKPVVRQIMKCFRPIVLPDTSKNRAHNKEAVYAAMNDVVAGLKDGDNILFYPAGRLNRSSCEDLAGNSGVEFIIRNIPDVKIVLVRTTGLWGSSFSRASGMAPTPIKHVLEYLKALICNGLFFGPKRKVKVEFHEDTKVSSLRDRSSINRYLETYYNEKPQTNTKVPYYWWQGDTPKQLPEFVKAQSKVTTQEIPVTVTTLVHEKIKDIVGVEVLGKERLSTDLGMDSLTVMELSGWLEIEFGTSIDDLASLDTVEDCIMAAAGQLHGRVEDKGSTPPQKWFQRSGKGLMLPDADKITTAFLQQAISNPKKILLADGIVGSKNYRDILTSVYALLPLLEKIEGKRVGIMLPASVSSAIVYLAVLFSGKTPVMFNWTVGVANMAHGIEETGVNTIISASLLCEKIEKQQAIELSELPVQWQYLDKISSELSAMAKITALVKAMVCKRKLSNRIISDTAAILFTSGSESQPKAVPLSHTNVLTNLQDFSEMLKLGDDTRMLGMLPPFHSLGLVGTIIMPLCLGLRTVYHANPTEPSIMAKIIETYGVSMVVATPTFLNGILQAGEPQQLKSLRLAFTGAEKCPEHVLENLEQTVPGAELCEGYGITECSPLVSINRPGEARPGTIGRVMPSIEYAIVDEVLSKRVSRGEQGLLLVRGASIFKGYLNRPTEKGFCEFEEKLWYQTGDFVRLDEQDYLVFCGRKKRFVKIAGEMISLPAIEDILLKTAAEESEAGPSLAVEATPVDGHPEIVLFTTGTLEREEVNSQLRKAGLSALHNIRRLIEVDAIPVLGTGKTDYKLLQSMLVT